MSLCADEGPKSFKGIEFSGFMRYRYEWTENPRPLAEDTVSNGLYISTPSVEGNAGVDAKSETRTSLWLNMDKAFNGKTRFHAAVQAETLSGRATDSTVSLKEAYGASRFGLLELALGRFLPTVGLGTIGGAPCSDGIWAHLNTAKLSSNLYLVRWGQQLNTYQASICNAKHETLLYADVKYRPIRGLTLSLAYNDDISSPANYKRYQGFAGGFEYKYVSNNTPWLTLSGEYSENVSAQAKSLTIQAPLGAALYTASASSEYTPKAWFLAAKTLGAHPFRPGTFGLELQYRYADPAFDILGMASPLTWNVPMNWSSPSPAGLADNHKGLQLTGEVTAFEGVIFKASFGFMKTTDPLAYKDLGAMGSVAVVGGVPFYQAASTDSQKYLTAQVVYLF
nr:hypothetical protein [uncultured Holophaga sp.]